MPEEKIFADGFSFKRRENAPDFVVGRVSIKVDEAIAFLKKHQSNGWVSLNTNKSKQGTYYMELDTFVPTQKSTTTYAQPEVIEVEEDEPPF
jgi:hypothetical protein